MVKDVETAWRCAYDLRHESKFIDKWAGNFKAAAQSGLKPAKRPALKRSRE